MKNNYNRMFNEQRGTRAETQIIDEVIPSENTEEVKKVLENNETVAPPKEPKDFKVVNCSNLNVREKADRGSAVKTIVKAGDVLMVEGVSKDWAHVYTTSGTEGFVMREFIEEV